MLPVKRIKIEVIESDEESERNQEESLEAADISTTNNPCFSLCDMLNEASDVDFQDDRIKQEFNIEEYDQEADVPEIIICKSEPITDCPIEEFECVPRKSYFEMRKKIDEYECNLSKYLVEKEYLLYTIKTLKANLEKLGQENLETKTKAKDRCTDCQNQQENELQITRLKNELGGLKDYICLLSINNTKLKNEVISLKEKVVQQERKNVLLSANKKNQETQNKQLRTRLASLEDQVKDSQSKLQNSEANSRRFQREIDRLKCDVCLLKVKNEQLYKTLEVPIVPKLKEQIQALEKDKSLLMEQLSGAQIKCLQGQSGEIVGFVEERREIKET